MKARTLKLLCGGLALAVGGGGYAAYASVKKPTVNVVTRTASAATGDVTEKITSTGTVSASSTVNLSFSGTGKLIELPVAVGSVVKAGDVIARIDPASAQTALATAKANLTTAQAKYATTVAGLTKNARAQLTLSVEQGQAQVDTRRPSPSPVRRPTSPASSCHCKARRTMRLQQPPKTHRRSPRPKRP